MANKRRAYDKEAWTNAKRICRLNARQVEMARALGMNPGKLPGLRPSPQERWKLPVGEFIEEHYRKRFGDTRNHEPRGPEPRSSKPLNADQDADVSERVRNPAWQLRDLVCYLMNLADDLQQWLEQGTKARDVLPQLSEELREIAKALDTGAPISPIPAIPLPPRPTHPRFLRRSRQDRTLDDEIPF